MYRLDRIGPWPLVSFNKPLLYLSTADLNAAGMDHPVTDFGCLSLNNVAYAEYSHETFNTNITLGQILQDNRAWGLGVQVVGSDENTDKAHFYAVSGDITWDSADNITVQAVIGRLDAAPSITTNVQVSNPQVLPVNHQSNGVIHSASINMAAVSVYGAGGSIPTPPADIQPIVAFWRIANYNGGTDARLQGITGSIGIHKYVQDISNFDPPR